MKKFYAFKSLFFREASSLIFLLLLLLRWRVGPFLLLLVKGLVGRRWVVWQWQTNVLHTSLFLITL
jgi:hypothetical protein